MMNPPVEKYQSYLLRLWQDSAHSHWYASVQSVQTSQVIHFADLEALIGFLWSQTVSAPPKKSEVSKNLSGVVGASYAETLHSLSITKGEDL